MSLSSRRGVGVRLENKNSHYLCLYYKISEAAKSGQTSVESTVSKSAHQLYQNRTVQFFHAS